MSTPDQISKLPKWAQEHIAKLSRERDIAARSLREWTDNQTPSAVKIEELAYIGEQRGPSHITRYVHTNKLDITHGGVVLSILLNSGPHSRDNSISISWSAETERSSSHVAFVPTSFQQASLIAKTNMRD